jgi:hypothetical protein
MQVAGRDARMQKLFDHLDLWSYDGTLDRIHHALYMECRQQGEREAPPSRSPIAKA